MGHKVSESELAYIPKNTIMIDDQKIAGQLIRLMDALDDMDDVTATHANFDLSEEVAKSLS